MFRHLIAKSALCVAVLCAATVTANAQSAAVANSEKPAAQTTAKKAKPATRAYRGRYRRGGTRSSVRRRSTQQAPMYPPNGRPAAASAQTDHSGEVNESSESSPTPTAPVNPAPAGPNDSANPPAKGVTPRRSRIRTLTKPKPKTPAAIEMGSKGVSAGF